VGFRGDLFSWCQRYRFLPIDNSCVANDRVNGIGLCMNNRCED
jgi:hypothetical protein